MEQQDPARQLAAPPLDWLFGDLPSAARRSRTARIREWHRVERGEPRTSHAVERWRLTVRGRVQGVGFRAGCQQWARQLNLSGWVRNTRDGAVEVEAEGPAHALTELRLWCERGPSGATVHGVTTVQIPATHEDWFEIRR